MLLQHYYRLLYKRSALSSVRVTPGVTRDCHAVAHHNHKIISGQTDFLTAYQMALSIHNAKIQILRAILDVVEEEKELAVNKSLKCDPEE